MKKKLEILETKIHGEVVIIVFKRFTLTTNRKGWEAIKQYLR